MRLLKVLIFPSAISVLFVLRWILNHKTLKVKNSIQERISHFSQLKFKSAVDLNMADTRNVSVSITSNRCFYYSSNFLDIQWKMYIFVKSSEANFKHRDLIRSTWASVSYTNGGKFVTMFIIGKRSQKYQGLIDEELERYEDILLSEEPDDYENVRFKTLEGMRWASENLSDEDLYSSADDDMFVDIKGVKETVDIHRRSMLNNNLSAFPILCMYGSRIDDVPMRDKVKKSWISYEEYPLSHWPDYCLGGMYTTSVGTIKDLWKLSLTEKGIKLDDVWITGILREKLGIPRQAIITIDPQLAFHYNGFSTKSEYSALQHHWKKIYDKLKEKTFCIKE